MARWLLVSAGSLFALGGCEESMCARACKKAHDECEVPGSSEECIANCSHGDLQKKQGWIRWVRNSKCSEIRRGFVEQD